MTFIKPSEFKNYHNKKNIVAFIDILGFKELIKNSGLIKDDVLRFLYQIREKNSSFEYKLHADNQWIRGQIKFDITSFSDHMIISVPILPENHPNKSEKELLFWLVMEISQFISEIHTIALMYGFILRGNFYIHYLYFPFYVLSHENLKEIKTIIERHILKNKENLIVLTKWRWLAVYFNETLELFNKNEKNESYDVGHITLVTDS